ncbi:MAG: sugar ABC transporter permease [Clostridiales bacterium]|nr:sugar ABC transporter permease [Clostridiales bacterium]
MKGNTALRRPHGRLGSRLAPYIYILPATLFMFIFVGIPILMSVYMSFFRIESVNSDWTFAGFSNFSDVFTRNDFGPAMLRTLVLAMFSVITTLGGGLLLANMVAHHKWLNFYRYIFYVPTVVSAITMGRLWSMMLMPSASGLMNTFIRNVFGVQTPVNWLGDPRITLYVVMGIGLVGVGGGMTLILFTTAINDISQEIREAAILDGINGWQMLWRITVPMIWPVISSWTILSIIGSFKSFEFIYALTGGGPAGSTQTIAILLYESSKTSSNGYGYSAAMGLLLTLFVSIFSLVYMRISNYGKTRRD